MNATSIKKKLEQAHKIIVDAYMETEVDSPLEVKVLDAKKKLEVALALARAESKTE